MSEDDHVGRLYEVASGWPLPTPEHTEWLIAAAKHIETLEALVLLWMPKLKCG
jgi:hypothetical protein